MKNAGRRTPNRWATVSSNRAPGAGGQNRSCSSRWAEKQENFQPAEKCFFLTSPFIELIRSCPHGLGQIGSDNYFRVAAESFGMCGSRTGFQFVPLFSGGMLWHGLRDGG